VANGVEPVAQPHVQDRVVARTQGVPRRRELGSRQRQQQRLLDVRTLSIQAVDREALAPAIAKLVGLAAPSRRP
jgi:hypothetical protein